MPTWIFIDIFGSPRRHEQFCVCRFERLDSVSVIWTSCLVAWTPNAGPGLSWASTFQSLTAMNMFGNAVAFCILSFDAPNVFEATETLTDNHGDCDDFNNKATETSAKNEMTNFSRVARPLFALLLVLMAPAGAMLAQTPQEQAWNILRAGVRQKSAGKRTQAVRALRLLPGDIEAEGMAQAALQDRKPEVRAAAATAIGLMGSKTAIPGLKVALSDRKPAVALAAAHALQVLNDQAGYQVYYEVLTRERKSTEGLVDQQMETLKDRKKMAELGFEEGLSFIPFADIGFSATKELLKDDSSSVRAAAARSLVNDSDPRIGQALVRAASDKSWMVRASALLAIAKRGDPQLLDAIVPALSDKNGVVRCTAAAAVIRLTTVSELEDRHDREIAKKSGKGERDGEEEVGVEEGGMGWRGGGGGGGGGKGCEGNERRESRLSKQQRTHKWIKTWRKMFKNFPPGSSKK